MVMNMSTQPYENLLKLKTFKSIIGMAKKAGEITTGNTQLVLKWWAPCGTPSSKMGFLFLMATNCQMGTKVHALCATEETEGSLLIAEAR